MICRVCGAEYDGCVNTAYEGKGVFRWKDVACSQECGRVYLQKVLEARDELPKEKKSEAIVIKPKEKFKTNKNIEEGR